MTLSQTHQQMHAPRTGSARRSLSGAASPQWTPRQLLDQALAKVAAAGNARRLQLDPRSLLHVDTRMVQKDGISIGGIEFWHETLRPWTGRRVEVRYDAAAADRGDLHEIAVYLVAAGEVTVVQCPARATMQNVLDRQVVRKHRMAYRDTLRAEVEQAEVGSARRARGAAAAARQEALHRKRHVQGRPGQEHSGLGPVCPEVERGIREHRDQILRRKAKNRGLLHKDEPKGKARSGATSRQARSSSSSRTRRSDTPSSNPWQDMAADSAPSSTRKAKRHSA